MILKVVELLVNLNEVNVAFSVVKSARTGTTMTLLTRKTVLRKTASVYVSFCSLTKGITPKICWFCLTLISSVLLNPLCVWILFYLRHLQETDQRYHSPES